MATAAAPVLSTFQIIEADVMNFISKVENEVEIIIGDAETALSNVAKMVPGISADIQAVATFIEGIPVVGQNPAVLAAVTAANVAMAGLNAFASNYNQATSGSSITVTQATQAVVAGFQAAQAAKGATATLAAAATGATSKTPAADVPVTPPVMALVAVPASIAAAPTP